MALAVYSLLIQCDEQHETYMSRVATKQFSRLQKKYVCTAG